MAIQDWSTVGISNHFMFRMVMEKPELCKEFLERVLDIKIKTIEDPESEKSLEAKLSSKGVRLDMYVEDENGVAYDLEMQASDADGDSLGKRMRYYQSMMDSEALNKGDLYSKLRKSYVIFVCTYDPFDAGLRRYSFANTCKETDRIKLNDESYKIIINTQGKKDNLSNELCCLVDYINDGVPKDEYTQKLHDEVDLQRNDKQRRVLYMTFEQTLMEAEDKGLQRGLAEGRVEGIQNTVMICRELGVSDDVIISKLMQKFKLSELEAKSYL